VFLLLFWVSAASAVEIKCDAIKSHQDFFACSLGKHPKLEIAQLRAKEGDALIAKASQWENPEVLVKSVAGTQTGENVGSTEVALNIPISQFWVRRPLKNVAQAEKRLGEIEAQQSLIEVKKELIRDLYRFRQIDDDFELVDETLEAFEKLRKQLAGRRARGPDQEITLNLVQLATSDYQLRRNHLQVEKSEILSRFKALWGPAFEPRREFFPPLRDSWPQVSGRAEASRNLAVQWLVVHC
jgi:hypothetical protein